MSHRKVLRKKSLLLRKLPEGNSAIFRALRRLNWPVYLAWHAQCLHSLHFREKLMESSVSLRLLEARFASRSDLMTSDLKDLTFHLWSTKLCWRSDWRRLDGPCTLGHHAQQLKSRVKNPRLVVHRVLILPRIMVEPSFVETWCTASSLCSLWAIVAPLRFVVGPRDDLFWLS